MANAVGTVGGVLDAKQEERLGKLLAFLEKRGDKGALYFEMGEASGFSGYTGFDELFELVESAGFIIELTPETVPARWRLTPEGKKYV